MYRENKFLTAWGWEWGQRLTVKEQKGSYWGDGNVLGLYGGAGCTTW